MQRIFRKSLQQRGLCFRSLLTQVPIKQIIDPMIGSFSKPLNEEPQNSSLLDGNYNGETDISEIHRFVIAQLQAEIKEIPKLQEEINRLEAKLAKESLKAVDIKMIRSRINQLEKEIKIRSSEDKIKEYLERVSPILDEWTSLEPQDSPFKFGEEKTVSPIKLSLVRVFIQIANEYYPLNLTFNFGSENRICPYCRSPTTEEDGKLICQVCEYSQELLIYEADFKDLPKINGTNSNSYINRETFLKALNCYQGKQKVEFPSELWKKFDNYCEFNRIRKETLNYEQTRPIFKILGYSKYFDDINLFLFMHPEIKRELPDLTEYESLILQDYDQFSQKYAEIKGDERDSALNSWYLLYILCRRRKIPCKRSDLKMPETPSIRISNDQIARKVFESLGWEFEDTI